MPIEQYRIAFGEGRNDPTLHQNQRIQTPPSPSWYSREASEFWEGLAVSDYFKISGLSIMRRARSLPLSILVVLLIMTAITGFLAYMGMIEKSLSTASRVGTSHSSGTAAVVKGLGFYTAMLILWLWISACSRYKNLIRLCLVVLWLVSLSAYYLYFF
jgi:hypothetical protein